MGRLVTIAAAAKLLGINRRELQRMIRDGDLVAFEGKVDMDVLGAMFPQLSITPEPLLERLEFIRATAFARRVRDTLVPDQDDLERQLRWYRTEHSVQRARAERLDQILADMLRWLNELQLSEEPTDREFASRICAWLKVRLGERGGS